jgi:phosphoglycolate phosphatase-like HAD superfamily hydrolase
MDFHAAQIIAFDNDGTLYPAGPEVGRVVLDAHRKYVQESGLDIETPTQEWLEHMIGADAKEFYAAMMPGQPEAVRRQFEDFCLEYEREAVARYPHMYDGAAELLSALKTAGKTLLLVTNGGPTYVEFVWNECGYDRWLSQAYPYAPPDFLSKGERLAQAISDWGGGPAVMVGDRASDIEAAQHAGVPCIGCRYGYGREGELAAADAQVDSVAELLPLLLPGR